ncbi:DUF2589 domain-containing protein [Pedobacter frigiditerrae]|uniref:DUF2589 domain-containing protein n=1 Tax=Pedobacter frigiditerrae TaxID=2530452 RepID=A0A4R0MST4_9SPHI|nr:DUF2589 domain-containing protein [Pedobacter frigiditerrae]TCC90058.1 DUF2589 domain-containing protein [Pedobacter frigiditerrae]
MPKVTNQKFNPNFSKALDIESLISAPLVAVSKANVVMAQGQTRFLLEYCFKKNGDGYEPILIQMALTKPVIDRGKVAVKAIAASAPGVIPVVEAVEAAPAVPQSIQLVTTHFSLPLLTIVPMNSLVVDKVTIDFDMEITSVASKPSNGTNESGNKITDRKAQLYGKVSDSGSNSNRDSKNQSKISNKVKININAATLPLPAGVLTIIDLYTKSIQAVPTENKQELFNN